MQFPVTIRLRRPRSLPLAWALLMLPALWLAMMAPHPPFWRLGWCLLCLWSCGQGWRAWRRLPLNLVMQADGLIRLGADGVARRVLPGACVHPWLTVFRLENGSRRPLTVVVTVDSLEAADFRRLRVFLRWRVSAPGAA